MKATDSCRGMNIPEVRWRIPDSKVHGDNKGPIWGRQDPGGPHVGPWTLLSGMLYNSGKKKWKHKRTMLWCSYMIKFFIQCGCTELNTSRPEQMGFANRFILNDRFLINATDVRPWGHKWQNVSNVSNGRGDRLSPNRRHAITLSNYDLVHCHVVTCGGSAES